jgi:hypothetical protein
MADSDEQQDESQESKPNWRRELEARAARASELEQQLADAQRELAFQKAGLGDLSDLQVKALGAAHEGDVTPDALKATAKALGFVKDEQPDEKTPDVPPAQPDLMSLVNQESGMDPDELTKAALAAHGRISNATVSSTPANPDPLQDMLQKMQEAEMAGGSQEDYVKVLRSLGLAQ